MIPTDMVYFLISYLIIIFGGYMFLNFLSGGYIGTFLNVKRFRGRRLLVRVHNKLGVYVVPGWIEGEDLCFHDRESKANKQKTPKRINIKDRGSLYRFSGLWTIDVDESTGNILRADWTVLPGWDPIRWNNVYIRALMKPEAEEKTNIIMIIVIIIVIIVLFVSIATLIKTGQLQSSLGTLQTIKAQTVQATTIT